MTTYATTLTIDFGEVGHWNSKEPFRVRLDAEPLAQLLRDAANAHRLYELLLIDRPGDVWAYVWVVPDVVPHRVVRRVQRARNEAQPRFDDSHPWPDDRLPFTVFDGFFSWMGDDTEPGDEAWLHHRGSSFMKAFAAQALAMVRAAQSRLEGGDDLLRHVAASVRTGKHAYCHLDREVARKQDRRHAPREGGHTPGFYQRLEALLRDPDLASVAYRADGDHRVLRMLAVEQRRRACLTGHEVDDALELNALSNAEINNDSWDSRIWFHAEGLGYGGLFIQGPGQMGEPIKKLVENYHRIPGKFILSYRDEGAIEGFGAPESGDGWAVYTRLEPLDRRAALERVSHRPLSRLRTVLSFAEGRTLFDHDKAIVVVGADVPQDAREILASAMGEWQQHGGRPFLLVLGDATAFEQAGCKATTAGKDLPADDASRGEWLKSLLPSDIRRWIDVGILLDAPRWAVNVLAERARHDAGPWPMWVVCTEGESALEPDHRLTGDLADALARAHVRAQALRPTSA